MPMLDDLYSAGYFSSLDYHFANTIGVIAQEDNPLVLLAAAAVSRATAQGHVCLEIEALAGTFILSEEGRGGRWPEKEDWLAALENSSLTARNQATAPLVLDDGNRLYLARYWDYQKRLLAQLKARAEKEVAGVDRVILGKGLLKRTNMSNFILLGGTMILALFLGRIFCGWICMFGWIQELPARLGQWIFKKRFTVPSAIDKPLRYLKYVVLFTALYFTWKMADLVISPYDPFAAYAHLPAGFTSLFDEYLIGAIILFGTIILSFFYDRVFCKYFCPMGAFLGIIYKFTNYKIKRDEETCIHCNKCTKACPVNIDVANLESVTDAECINCLECVTVCPTKKETLKPFVMRKYMKPLIVGIAGAVPLPSLFLGEENLQESGKLKNQFDRSRGKRGRP